MGSTYAVVIAVENYQHGILPVDFAAADAKAFKAVLLDRFGIPEANISFWIDQDATQSRLHNDLPYLIRQLGPDDKFIFFYAGHGFYINGSNRIATWDSHPSNLGETTTSVEGVLLDPLKKSICQSSLIFIDACAAELKKESKFARDVVADMTPGEFEAFVRSSAYSAAFFSCSPQQKSYSAPSLKHGIWTHHLLAALRGDDESAIERDRTITGDSLRDYLSVAIPKFIREKTSIRGEQRPFAILSSNGAFEVVRIPSPDNDAPALPKLRLDFAKTFFRGVTTRSFTRLEGFNKKRGHTVPTHVNEKAAAWGRRLLDPEIVAELEKTKDNAKEVLNLPRRAVSMSSIGDAGGSVDTDYFRFSVSADQNSSDPSEMIITRRIVLRVALKSLPANFDDIFEARIDEMIIPVSFDGQDYDEIADGLEEYARANGARFSELSSEGVITIKFAHPGPTIVLDSTEEELRISGPGAGGCLALINLLKANAVTLLMGSAPAMLGPAGKGGLGGSGTKKLANPDPTSA